MHWAIYPFLLIGAYFVWAGIHEVSHYLVARRLFDVVWVKFRLYPHYNRSLKTFYWAAVYYSPDSCGFLTRIEDAGKVSLAPRIPDVMAAILLTAAGILPAPWGIVWGVFLGAGLVDLLVGSIGISKNSDLQRVSRWLNLDPWWLRAAGLVIIVSSVAVTVWLGV